MFIKIVVLILFFSNICLSQNYSSTSCPNQFIKNELYINGKKKQILNHFCITMIDSLGQNYKPPINGECVDVRGIPCIVDWYRVVMTYDKLEFRVDIPTNMFLSADDSISIEEIIWEWYLTKNVSNDSISFECTFLLSLIDSEIELSLPAECNYSSSGGKK